jgi:hypothetical protein
MGRQTIRRTVRKLTCSGLALGVLAIGLTADARKRNVFAKARNTKMTRNVFANAKTQARNVGLTANAREIAAARAGWRKSWYTGQGGALFRTRKGPISTETFKYPWTPDPPHVVVMKRNPDGSKRINTFKVLNPTKPNSPVVQTHGKLVKPSVPKLPLGYLSRKDDDFWGKK